MPNCCRSILALFSTATRWTAGSIQPAHSMRLQFWLRSLPREAWLTSRHRIFSSGIDIIDAFSATVGYDQARLIATRDFVLDYKLAQEEVGLFTLTYRDPADTTETAGFFLALLEPGSVQPGEIISKHFTFVFDRSGSMGGGKIVQAKDAAHYCIEHLNANDFFNIIDFSSDVRQYKNEPVKATPANIAEAVNYVNNISANGGT